MPGTDQDPGARQTAKGTQAPQMPSPGQTTETTELPGDAVCWLRLVCTECGTIAESEPPAKCPQCGALLGAGR